MSPENEGQQPAELGLLQHDDDAGGSIALWHADDDVDGADDVRFHPNGVGDVEDVEECCGEGVTDDAGGTDLRQHGDDDGGCVATWYDDDDDGADAVPFHPSGDGFVDECGEGVADDAAETLRDAAGETVTEDDGDDLGNHAALAAARAALAAARPHAGRVGCGDAPPEEGPVASWQRRPGGRAPGERRP